AGPGGSRVLWWPPSGCAVPDRGGAVVDRGWRDGDVWRRSARGGGELVEKRLSAGGMGSRGGFRRNQTQPL
ncbi:hypothetical protein Dimus_022897, partial [Dionaea muscipula]